MPLLPARHLSDRLPGRLCYCRLIYDAANICGISPASVLSMNV
jgi:hypothetical protein